jgi:hypothetical protein
MPRFSFWTRLALIGAFALNLLFAACAPQMASPTPTPPAPAAARVDLSSVKTYLLGKVGELKSNTTQLKTISDRYYDLAKAANFDYAALWQSKPAEVKQTVEDARKTWIVASPLYEQMEGIVGGVASLSQYDIILDAGSSGAEDPQNAVPFDLTLPDGRVLPKPGNLFGVTESTLWGTFKDYTAQNVQPDFDGNGKLDFGETLPDANVLKAGAAALDSYTGDLQKDAQAWQPTEAQAFRALVVMVPTMTDLFDSWKNSRFVAGNTAHERDFVVISRLADIQNIIGSLQVVYQSVSPLAKTVDAAQTAQVDQGLADLKAFVADVYAKEKSGHHFSAEDADLLGTEAQNRATAITGQITQIAAKLSIPIAE